MTEDQNSNGSDESSSLGNEADQPTSSSQQNDTSQSESESSDVSATASGTLPPPASEVNSVSNSTSASTSQSSGRILKIGVLALVIVLGLGFLVFGRGSDGSSELEYAYFARDNNGEIYFASLKDDQVIASTRLGEYVKTITFLESISSQASQEILVVPSSDSYFVWSDDDISEIDKKTLTSVSIYRGEDIDNVFYIADAKTLLVNDESNCFAIPIGKQSTRIASGECQIQAGKIFTVDSSSEDTVLTEVNIKGESINRFSLAIGSSVRLHKSGRMISGISNADSGGFEVYSTSDGKRMFSAKAGEQITVLDEPIDSSSYLVAIENEAEDETLDIGILSFADGSGTVKVLTSLYSAKGWISPDSSKVLLLSQASEGNEKSDLNLWDVANATSQTVVSGIEELLDYSTDNEQRVALLTNRELIFGSFDNSFASRSSGSFDGGSLYFHADGILASIAVDDKYDLVYVKNGPADDSGNKAITLSTAADSITVYESSLVVDGYIYYSEESNDYTEVYRQKLTGDEARQRVAEGRISQLDILPNGQLFYSEQDGDRIVSYFQKNEKPDNKIQVSDRYRYYPRATSFNPAAIFFTGVQYRQSATATIDADAAICRELNHPFVNTGSSLDLVLTRANNSSYSIPFSDYEVFCVRNADTVAITAAARNDGDTSSSRWLGIQCEDSEGDAPSSRGNFASGEVSVNIEQRGVVICGVYDWNDYYSTFNYDSYEYDDPVRGMSVTVSVR
jgi:hypothetical protein